MKAGKILLLAALLLPAYLTFIQSPINSVQAQSIRDRLRNNLRLGNSANNSSPPLEGACERNIKLANLDVAVWVPANLSPENPAPIVLFSHGFHGKNSQSRFLTEALASDGYIVFAPNHQDAMGEGGPMRPQESFSKAGKWTDMTFKDRRDDMQNLAAALKRDPYWSKRIDWSRLALAGHSLGGYTALALAGAWPSWNMPGVKAVLALSPYCKPFIEQSTLANIHVPVMYQGGTRDYGITPTLRLPGGAYDATSSPCYLIVFNNAGHFSFANFNHSASQQNLMNKYSLAFLDRYVKGEGGANPAPRLDGVSVIESK